MRTTPPAFRCPRAARLSPLAAAIGLALAPVIAPAATYTVTSTAASGTGTLYEAIFNANSNCASDGNPVINFTGTGPFTVNQSFQLPSFFCPTATDNPDGSYKPTVDGGGAIDPSNAIGFDAHGILNGGGGSAVCGLTFPQNFTYGGHLTVTGMKIQNFTYGSLAAGVCGNVELYNNLFTGNTAGVLANDGNAIVGDSATGGNVIINNTYGVWVEFNNTASIENNKIGTPNGTDALGNEYGIYVNDSNGVTIQSNLISGNATAGIYLSNDYGGSINDNYIGTTADGDSALPNGTGIYMYWGGSANLNGNTISGNTGNGVYMENHTNTELDSNNIGVGFSLGALPNSRGVEAFCSGYIDFWTNTIGHNTSDGVFLSGTEGSYFSGNLFQSNGANGLRITNSSGSCFSYGSFNSLWDNDILDNGQNGVLITGLSTDNTIHYGSITGNNRKNISLNGGTAPLPNDSGDDDGGPNHQQNYPVINSVVQNSGSTDINVTLDGNPGNTYEVQFYANSAMGAPGGETYIGSYFMYGGDTVTASMSGQWDNISATATSPDICCGYGGDTSEFSPMKAALTAPAVTIGPASKDFGFVQIEGSSQPTTFILRSVGDQPYTIYDIQPGSYCYAELQSKAAVASSFCTSGGFTCSTTCSTDSSYSTGQTCSFTVRFTPTFAGFQSDQICIMDNTAAGQHFINVSGTGTLPPPLTIEPTSHDFGNVPVGATSESMRFQVTNRTPYGSLPVTVMTTGGEFDIVSDSCSPAIPPMSQCDVFVDFAPSASGDQLGELVVQGAAKPPSLGVSGFTLVQPEARASLQGVGVSGGQLVLPEAIDMGGAQIGGAPIGYPVELRNTGYGALTISSITVSSPFTLVNNCPATLAPAQACTVMLGFQATSLGEVHGSLTVVTSAEGGSRVVPVIARGQTVATPLLRVLPTSIGFGSRVIGSQGTSQTVTITNIGGATASLNLAMPSIDFLIAGNNCGATLAPQASCNAEVTFRPLGFGTRLGSFVVGGNAANAPQSVVITGTGCRPFAAGSSRFSSSSSCAP